MAAVERREAVGIARHHRRQQLLVGALHYDPSSQPPRICDSPPPGIPRPQRLRDLFGHDPQRQRQRGEHAAGEHDPHDVGDVGHEPRRQRRARRQRHPRQGAQPRAQRGAHAHERAQRHRSARHAALSDAGRRGIVRRTSPPVRTSAAREAGIATARNETIDAPTTTSATIPATVTTWRTSSATAGWTAM